MAYEAIGFRSCSPPRRRSRARKQWMADHLQVRGRVHLDEGAARALKQDGKSLLPIGVIDVAGAKVGRGEVVSWQTRRARDRARSINYRRERNTPDPARPRTRSSSLGYIEESELGSTETTKSCSESQDLAAAKASFARKLSWGGLSILAEAGTQTLHWRSAILLDPGLRRVTGCTVGPHPSPTAQRVRASGCPALAGSSAAGRWFYAAAPLPPRTPDMHMNLVHQIPFSCSAVCTRPHPLRIRDYPPTAVGVGIRVVLPFQSIAAYREQDTVHAAGRTHPPSRNGLPGPSPTLRVELTGQKRLRSGHRRCT